MAREDALRSGVEFSLDPTGIEQEQEAGLGPWRLTLRRLRRNRIALAFGVLFILLVGSALAAPLWADHVAHTTYREEHLADTIIVDGEEVDVVSNDDAVGPGAPVGEARELGSGVGIPIGPQWRGEYFLGADELGRDVMVRLLYGGRNSLMIGVTAALGTVLIGMLLGLLAGYFRGWVDGAISRALDVLWAFPVILLGVALGTALALGGLKLGPIEVAGDSLAIPILVISMVYIPYLARPVRGQVLALREKEFIEAARAQGMSSPRIIFTEVLPNVASTLVVFFPLLVANAILLEAALSFLGAGVRAPNPSWGTMIDDGVTRLTTAPHLAIAPGVMLVLTVLSLNIFGDGVRDALDPRSKVRIEH